LTTSVTSGTCGVSLTTGTGTTGTVQIGSRVEWYQTS
jgi:hypothetical protein